MKKFITILLISMIAFSCSQEVVITRNQAISFLYDNMPLPDRVTYSREFWEANVDKTLEVRNRMKWDVPQREFMHFVLPLRVNNEDLDNFRLEYADELCDRVNGLSMYEAVLEINHWCHEMATYAPSDARTSSPVATIRKGTGRCGEESVLGVAALRAVGIPARQVYTPRWAHTDDNHAWIEAYVNGRWYFLGACEPEPELDMAWFNGPVSRALILHTKAFGDYHGEEDVISRTDTYTEINVTSNYVPVRGSKVMVVDTLGNPVPAATVEYKIYNYAEFYTVAEYISDDEGKTSLSSGVGDMLAWASKDSMFGIARITSDSTVVVLNHRTGDFFSVDLDIVPPVENPIERLATDDQVFLNKERLEEENIIRENRKKGNMEVIEGFLLDNADNGNAQALLASLSEKDMNDVTREVLDDALRHCGDYFKTYRDCPRIENEFLLPYFSEIGKDLSFSNPSEIVSWVKNNIRTDDSANPQHLRMPPLSVWRSRCSDSFSRSIFYVALCRAKGFEARIDQVTGKTQYLQYGYWMDVDWDGDFAVTALQGYFKPYIFQCAGVVDPLYYTHFTLSEIDGGRARLLNFDENDFPSYSEIFESSIRLDEGYYMLTTGRRMADGSVLAHLEFFPVERYKFVTVPFILRSSDDKISVVGTMNANPFLEISGRDYFILAVTGNGDEPSVHAARQLTSMADELNEWGKAVIVLGGCLPGGIKRLSDGNELKSFGEDASVQVRNMLVEGCGGWSRSLPVVTICDSFGRIVYFSQGYNTSLAEDIRRVIGKL